MSDLKKRLHDLRTDNDLSMEKLAKLVGTQQSRISDIEKGTGYIRADDLPKYADALKTTVSFIVTGYDPSNEKLQELGLSNETINTLCSINRMAKEHKQQTSYYSDMLKVIDCLVKNQDLLATISGFLFNEFSTLEVINEKGFHSVPLTNGGTFTIDDRASIFRLRIMDKLNVLRNDLKGGKADETSKR